MLSHRRYTRVYNTLFLHDFFFSNFFSNLSRRLF
ncbi:hypothetical protein CP8484711_1083, partial [Chlamydia psittaci 84-8471/1]